MRIGTAMLMMVLLTLLLVGCSSSENQQMTQTETASGAEVTVSQTVAETTDSQAPELSLGYIMDGVYVNDYFGLSLKVPEGWVELTHRQVDAIMGIGLDVMGEGDAAGEEVLAEAQVLSLMGLFKYPLDAQVPMNPNVLANAEKVQGDMDASRYLELSRMTLEGRGLPYTFGDVTTTELHGRTVAMMKGSIEAGGITIIQDYHAMVVNGYVINIICTYSEEEGQRELVDYLK